jgi:hypothetical protein
MPAIIDVSMHFESTFLAAPKIKLLMPDNQFYQSLNIRKTGDRHHLFYKNTAI